MFNQPNILAITKRTAEMCATKALVDAAGYKLVVATNMAVARSMVRTLRIKAVIICELWSNEEIQEIASELINVIEIPVLMHCPGCTGCDEVAGRAGSLRDVTSLTKLISAIERPRS